MNRFADDLGLPSEDDIEALTAAFENAAVGLDAIVFPREREMLHLEINSFLAFVDFARAHEEAPPTLSDDEKGF